MHGASLRPIQTARGPSGVRERFREIYVNEAMTLPDPREPRARRRAAQDLRARRPSRRGLDLAAVARSARAICPRIRYHWRYLLAEIARDQGDHASAINHAIAVADTTSRSRLAPYALKLAGDETLAMGDDPSKALRFYQAVLERYPTSPLAPPVRARALEIRKKLQL
jgi:hypothetical protein